MIKLAVLASGEGTNAENIVQYFQRTKTATVTAVIANKKDIGIYRRIEKLGFCVNYVPALDFANGNALRLLQEKRIDFIILAGFLLKIPEDILAAYPEKIVNIHPALLPKYGGKGMYGNRVHAAVIANGEKESGITIHYIDNHYDKGSVLFQAKCPVFPEDTPETLANRVHQLEYEYYPQIIEAIILDTPIE